MGAALQNQLAILEGLLKHPSAGAAVRQLTSQLAKARLGLLTEAQLSAVIDEARQLVGETAPADPDSSAGPAPHTDVPLADSPAAEYAAFLATVDRGPELVTLINQLALATSSQSAINALGHIFIELLGYGALLGDETPRLRSTGTIQRLVSIARHREFVVSFAEVAFAGHYPNIAAPIFQLHPYGLVVLFSPEQQVCRFVYRLQQPRRAGKSRLRTLVGSRFSQYADNLVVWAYRLAKLRPAYGDDGAALLQKAHDALDPPAAAFAREWLSAPLALDAPLPGTPWEHAAQMEWQAFAQLAPPGPRWLWGLERVLRDVFPVTVAGGAATLTYQGYTVTGEAVSWRQAIREGTTMGKALQLHLALTTRDGENAPLTIEAMLPTLRADGVFLLAGGCYRLIPAVLADGQLAIYPVRRRPVVEDQDFSFTEVVARPQRRRFVDAELTEQKPEDPSDADASPVGKPPTGPPTLGEDRADAQQLLPGASLGQLLEQAARRKLVRLGHRLWHLQLEDTSIASLVFQIDLAVANLRGRDRWFLVVGRSFLQEHLTPQAADASAPTQRLPVLRQADPGQPVLPPAWACLDTSASLPFGYFLPVAGTRLNPMGGLTVPLAQPDGTLRLGTTAQSALAINPRAGGSAQGPRRLWIAEPLAALAALPAGSIESAAPRICASLRLPEVVVWFRPGAQAGCRVSPQLLTTLPRERRSITVRLTTPHWANLAPPTLAVTEGQAISAGAVWLRASRSFWCRQQSKSRLRKQRAYLQNLFDTVFFVSESQKLERDRPETFRVPSSLSGIVLECQVTESRDRNGGNTGYRATLTVLVDRIQEDAAGFVALDDGRLIPILGTLDLADAPFDSWGETASIVITDPELPDQEATQHFFAGEDGELFPSGFAVRKQLELLPRSAPLLRQPDQDQRSRARDHEGIPAHPSSPALSARQRLFWALREPATASQLAAREILWRGGEPGYQERLRELLIAARLDGAAADPVAAAAQALVFWEPPALVPLQPDPDTSAVPAPSPTPRAWQPFSSSGLGYLLVERPQSHVTIPPQFAALQRADYLKRQTQRPGKKSADDQLQPAVHKAGTAARKRVLSGRLVKGRFVPTQRVERKAKPPPIDRKSSVYKGDGSEFEIPIYKDEFPEMFLASDTIRRYSLSRAKKQRSAQPKLAKHEPLDPMRRKRSSPRYDPESEGRGVIPQSLGTPVLWRCVGGHISGYRTAFMRCILCRSAVLPWATAPTPEQWPWIQLPEPVLHPWRIDAAAALLGLARQELLALQAELAPDEFQQRFTLALNTPTALILKRITETKDASVRARLMWCSYLLGLELRHPDSAQVARWQLVALPVPPFASEMTGMHLRAPGPVSSPLTLAYQRVHFAALRLRRLAPYAPRTVREEGRRALQESVLQLFGPPDQKPHADEPASLAQLVSRLWPLTRAGGLRSSMKGMLSIQGLVNTLAVDKDPAPPKVTRPPRDEMFLRPPRPITAPSSALLPAPADTVSIVVVDGNQVLVAPQLPRVHGSAGTIEYWRRRTAQQQLMGDFLGFLLGTVGCLVVTSRSTLATPFTGPGTVNAQWLGTLGIIIPEAEAEGYPIGRFLVAELLRAVEHPDARIFTLLELLSLPLSRFLPSDATLALQPLADAITAAFPGTDAQLEAARVCLGQLCCGFYQVPVSAAAPLGWLWLPPQHPAPPSARRALPPMSSNAWLLHTPLLAVRMPVYFLTLGSSQKDWQWQEGLKIALGLPGRPVAPPIVPSAAATVVESPPVRRAPRITTGPAENYGETDLLPPAQQQATDVPPATPDVIPIVTESLSADIAIIPTEIPDVQSDSEIVEIFPLQTSLRGWLGIPQVAVKPSVAAPPVPKNNEPASPPVEDVQALQLSLSSWLRKERA